MLCKCDKMCAHNKKIIKNFLQKINYKTSTSNHNSQKHQMLSIFRTQNADRSLFCGQLLNGEPIYFSESLDADPLAEQIHVTKLTSMNQDACLVLDRISRNAFENIEVRVNTIDLLQSPAGSGKSTSIVQTGYNMLISTESEIYGLTYNKEACRDCREKTKYESRFKWFTIDSKVHALFKPRQEDYIDVEHTHLLIHGMIKILHYDESEIDKIAVGETGKLLREAANTGDISELDNLGKELWQKMLNGDWWCYSGLRVMAYEMKKTEWIALFDSTNVVFVDESQDLNCISHKLIELLQPTKHIIYCMDSSQRLYEFMKCINVRNELKKTKTPHTVWKYYTTFRFGQELCDYLNKHFLGSSLTFPHPNNTKQTTVHHHLVNDIDVEAFKNKPYTYIISSWQKILEAADDLMNEGRLVRIPADKYNELLECVQIEYSKHESHLFKKLNKRFISDILDRLQQPDSPVLDNEVFICTCHHAKGIEWPNVRIGNCIARSESMAIVYVALTRAICEISIPKYKIQTACTRNKRFGTSFEKSTSKRRRY